MPPATLPGSTDAKNKFEDLSGVDIAAYANPYDALIEACGDSPVMTRFFSLQPQSVEACVYSPLNCLQCQVFFIRQQPNIPRHSSRPAMTLTAQRATASKRPNSSPQ